MGGVLDGLHSGGVGGGDVLGFIVDEEDLVSGSVEAFGSVLVDGKVGFRDAEAMREGVMIKLFQHREVCADA